MLTGTTLAIIATVTATKTVAMTALQKILVAATIAVLAGAGIYEARQASQLRHQVQMLQRQQVPHAEQIEQLNRLQTDSSNRLIALREDNDRLTRNSNELLKLRGEIGVLRRQLASQKIQVDQQTDPQKERISTKAHTPGSYIPSDELAPVGYATPEAALETHMWAMMRGTYEQINEGVNPEMLTEELKDPKYREAFESQQKITAPIFNGMQILAKKTLTDDKVELKVKHAYDLEAMKKLTTDITPEFIIQPMINVSGEWKLGGSTRGYKSSWEEDGQIQSFNP